MAKLSVSKAWDDTSAFLKRYGGMATAIALAFMALPSILAAPALGDVQQRLAAGVDVPPDEVLAVLPWMILTVLISLVGTLAIYALALRPGVSVGEAIAHGFRRLLPTIAAGILLTLAGIILFVVPFVLLSAVLNAGAAAGLLSLLAVPLAFYLIARVYLWQPAIVDGRGPIAAIRESWRLTQGNAGRIVVLLVVVILVALVIYLAGTFVFAGLASALGRAIGGDTVALLLGATVTSILSAIISTVFAVLAAMVYRQLRGDATGA